jgi:triosephosphate isomerase
MQKSIIANWKMYLSAEESIDLTGELLKFIKNKKNLPEIIICPSFPTIGEIKRTVKNSNKLALGAQNMHWADRGAYTGEVSPIMLKELGCRFIILGHSERRRYFNENNRDVHKKVRIALEHGLTPIVCVGESGEERRAGKRDEVVRRQVSESLDSLDISKGQRVIIAYEPVWVIGTGQAVEPDDAVHSHEVIKQTIIDTFSENEFNLHFQIIYGGSVDEKNLAGFLEKDIISGVLVGGASTKPESLKGLIEVCLNS